MVLNIYDEEGIYGFLTYVRDGHHVGDFETPYGNISIWKSQYANLIDIEADEWELKVSIDAVDLKKGKIIIASKNNEVSPPISTIRRIFAYIRLIQ